MFPRKTGVTESEFGNSYSLVVRNFDYAIHLVHSLLSIDNRLAVSSIPVVCTIPGNEADGTLTHESIDEDSVLVS